MYERKIINEWILNRNHLCWGDVIGPDMQPVYYCHILNPSFNVVECLQGNLVPVIIYIVVAINKLFPWRPLFSALLMLMIKKKTQLARQVKNWKAHPLLPEDFYVRKPTDSTKALTAKLPFKIFLNVSATSVYTF